MKKLALDLLLTFPLSALLKLKKCWVPNWYIFFQVFTKRYHWNHFVSFEELGLIWKFTLCEKCPYSQFFFSVIYHVQTEYGEIRTRKTLNTWVKWILILDIVHQGNIRIISKLTIKTPTKMTLMMPIWHCSKSKKIE